MENLLCWEKSFNAIHGIDSVRDTKAVSLNRFYAVDNKAISERQV